MTTSSNSTSTALSASARRAFAFLAVLGVALSLRWTAIDLPHFDSDEPAYEGIAQSILSRGGYTCRHVGLDVVSTRGPLALVALRPDARSHAGVLDFYAPEHQDAMDDQAVSPRSPLLPVLLAASVAALGSGAVEVVAVNRLALGGAPQSSAYAWARAQPDRAWRRAQLPLVLVPLLASVAACALAFVAPRVGVVASLLGALALATAPIEVWCAHRVTADTLAEALVGGAVTAAVFVRGPRSAAAAGLLAGLAVLAKSSALAVAAAIGLCLLLGEDRKRRTLAFVAGMVVGGLWWPIGRALLGGGLAAGIGYGGVGLPAAALEGSWPAFTRSRPFWVVPATTALLSPALGLGAAGLVLRARDPRVRPLALTALAFVLVTMIWPSRENRFLLPAYVPLAAGLALLAEHLLERARGSAAKGALVLVVLALMAPSIWYARGPALSGAYELAPIGPRSPS